MNTWWWWPRCCWALILVTLVYGYIMTMGVRLDLEHHAEVGLHSDNESYQEMCQTNAQCPGKFMHCQASLDWGTVLDLFYIHLIWKNAIKFLTGREGRNLKISD